MQQTSSETLEVAAAVIRDAQGRVLVSQRAAGKHLADAWEFPGGKIEPGESVREALERELHEELGIRPGPSRPLVAIRHEYPDKTVRLCLHELHAFEGTPHGRENQALRWVAVEDLGTLEMPPADRPLIRLLELDGYYALSPSPAALGGEEPFVEAWRDCLAAGFRLLRLSPAPDEDISPSLIDTLTALCQAHHARWIAAGELTQCFGWPADGIHLDTRQLMTLDKRPLPDDKLVIAACHDLEEIRIAESLPADLVTLAPVETSPSHPDATPIGWHDFERVVRYSPLPVLALGGVTPDDWMRARNAGAFGVAGSKAFGWA